MEGDHTSESQLPRGDYSWGSVDNRTSRKAVGTGGRRTFHGKVCAGLGGDGDLPSTEILPVDGSAANATTRIDAISRPNNTATTRRNKCSVEKHGLLL